MNFLMVFDFTQFWLDGRPGNEYFWISHTISGLLTPLTPLTPLGVHLQCLLKMKSDLDWSNSSQCATGFQKPSPKKGCRQIQFYLLLTTPRQTASTLCLCNVQPLFFFITIFNKIQDSYKDVHIECSKQFKWNSHFSVSGQSRPFLAALKLL